MNVTRDSALALGGKAQSRRNDSANPRLPEEIRGRAELEVLAWTAQSDRLEIARKRESVRHHFIKCTPQAARAITAAAIPPIAITAYDALRAADSDITRVRFQRAWQPR